ncbi:beta family protein [Vreelandella boliviensis]|uniref:beta family protein n=1 Tax=Vreelandella boliviensis TaxID=223527 RepID=UPI001B8BC29B|nr:beta family protein [Halomonas boliviensis]MBS3669923.1 beta family protein [Halomonas boliviensis]
MSEFLYFPMIKTRDAELRCLSNIEADRFNSLLPIYELTKSRKTVKAPDGDIYRRMKNIGEIQGERPFILDLCTDDKYINPQIEQLLSPYMGFKDWQYFIFDLHNDLNIIPMIHIYEDEGKVAAEVEAFVKAASERTNFLAVRLPYDLGGESVLHYLQPIFNSLSEGCKVYVILDAGFTRNEMPGDVADKFIDSCSCLNDVSQYIEDIIIISTSFPSNVAKEGGGDSEGKFDIFEENIFQKVVEEVDVKYGDYASINTEQIEIRGGTFVPRIDIASLDGFSFTYKRHRRNAGGYVKCAKEVVQDVSNYQFLGTWADNEINLAKDDTPTGISPAFWISVRMNYYIETRLRLRSSSN